MPDAYNKAGRKYVSTKMGHNWYNWNGRVAEVYSNY